MQTKVEDTSLQIDVREIAETADKIIKAVDKDPSKFRKVKTFFDYYLPVTIKILKRYDDIENQRLVSEDSKKFMNQARNLISEVQKAYKKQLASMYQSEIVDTDAEMKVLDMMLKSEGLDSNNIESINK